jgi:hypothetical protein
MIYRLNHPSLLLKKLPDPSLTDSSLARRSNVPSTFYSSLIHRLLADPFIAP